MLDAALVERLQQERNLLAFSAGVDSTALFFLLIEHDIPFDLAIVNYHTRESSDAEAAYAATLAMQHDKQLYTLDATLSDTAYEANARNIRYTFFENLIQENGYTVLLTAHQLNDQLEWFLMQLSKGAGALELVGMQTWTQRDAFRLCRPLLTRTKEELQNYLDQKGYRYFIDSSNSDQSLKRNFIRHHFSDSFLEHYKDGVMKSFAYLQEDQEQLLGEVSVKHIEELTIIDATTPRALLYLIDKELKRRGYTLSAAQRDAIHSSDSVVIGGNYIVESLNNRAYIAPVIENPVMPKKFKEACRVAHIPLKIRAYLFSRGIDISLL